MAKPGRSRRFSCSIVSDDRQKDIGMGASLDWPLVRRGETPTIRKLRVETRPKGCIAHGRQLCDIFKVTDNDSGRRRLLHSRLEEMSVAALRHPARARQVAVVDYFGSIRLACWVESEDDQDHFAPIRAFLISIKQPEIGHEMPLVIGVHALGLGRAVVEG
jgi:hypothetical protein